MQKMNRAFLAIWLPVAASAAILAAAMTLYGCIRQSQKAELSRTVSTVRVSASAGAPGVQRTSEPTSQPTYTVVTETPDAAVPAVGEIDCDEAADAVAAFIETLFGESLDQAVLHVGYTHYEGMNAGSYGVRVSKAADGPILFYASVDAKTGAVLYVTRELSSTQQITPTLTDEEIGDLFTKVSEDPKYPQLARELVASHLAGGRTIEEISFSAVQWAFDAEVETICDFAVRMSEGECYHISYSTPDDRLYSVSVYPLGWHSCLWGYQNAAEASEYPSLEEMELQSGPIVQKAHDLFNTPYRKNGHSADGVDEAGFIRLCVEASGVKLPAGGLDKISVCDGKTFVKITDAQDLLPGDILFFMDGQGRFTGAGVLIHDRMFHYVSETAGKVSYSTLDDEAWATSFAYGMRIPTDKWRNN